MGRLAQTLGLSYTINNHAFGVFMAIEVTGDAVVTSDFTVRTSSITSVSVTPSFWGVVLSLCFFVGIGYLFKNFSWLVLIGV